MTVSFRNTSYYLPRPFHRSSSNENSCDDYLCIREASWYRTKLKTIKSAVCRVQNDFLGRLNHADKSSLTLLIVCRLLCGCYESFGRRLVRPCKAMYTAEHDRRGLKLRLLPIIQQLVLSLSPSSVLQLTTVRNTVRHPLSVVILVYYCPHGSDRHCIVFVRVFSPWPP